MMIEELKRVDLVERGIDEELVDRLIADQISVLNCVDASRYCCFAVRDAEGHLRSLFNRRIDGPSERDKFLLGRQSAFCMDWDSLAQASVVYVCEGIMDALSLLTLTPQACVVALPGTNCDFSELPLPPQTPLIEAFDADPAGRNAAVQLQKHFPKQTIQRFDLMGANDVNEYLQERKWMSEEVEEPRSNGKLSVKDRIAIALSDWPSRALARKYGVHHSRVCDIRNEANAILKQAWADRHPGPKPKPVPSPDFQETKCELKKVMRALDMANMRKDWLTLQLDISKQRDLEVERKQQRNKRSLEAAIAYADTKPPTFLRRDNGKAFETVSFQATLNGCQDAPIPPGQPWFNGSLESNNRSLTDAIKTTTILRMPFEPKSFQYARQNIDQAVGLLQETCDQVFTKLNEKIARTKFSMPPAKVLNGHTKSTQERHQNFIHRKREERKERMEILKREPDKPPVGKTFIQKVRQACTKLLKQMQTDHLYVIREVLHHRYQAMEI